MVCTDSYLHVAQRSNCSQRSANLREICRQWTFWYYQCLFFNVLSSVRLWDMRLRNILANFTMVSFFTSLRSVFHFFCKVFTGHANFIPGNVLIKPYFRNPLVILFCSLVILLLRQVKWKLTFSVVGTIDKIYFLK